MALRLITRLKGLSAEPKVRHYVGLPPELTEGNDRREVLPPSALLVIEETPDGIFLVRFTANGQFAGDTWHKTVEEAKQQALFEFGGLVATWTSVPVDVEDVVSFALNQDNDSD